MDMSTQPGTPVADDEPQQSYGSWGDEDEPTQAPGADGYGGVSLSQAALAALATTPASVLSTPLADETGKSMVQMLQASTTQNDDGELTMATVRMVAADNRWSCDETTGNWVQRPLVGSTGPEDDVDEDIRQAREIIEQAKKWFLTASPGGVWENAAFDLRKRITIQVHQERKKARIGNGA